MTRIKVALLAFVIAAPLIAGAEDAKQKIEAEEAEKKRQADLATQAAEEVVKKQEACAAATGTGICMKNVFFNVPARRNFLKSNAAEMPDRRNPGRVQHGDPLLRGVCSGSRQ